MEIDKESVQRHYTRPPLLGMIPGALERTGKDLAQLSPDDLAAVDEFHTHGRAATVELAQLASLAASDNVLDVGSGAVALVRACNRPDGRVRSGLHRPPRPLSP